VANRPTRMDRHSASRNINDASTSFSGSAISSIARGQLWRWPRARPAKPLVRRGGSRTARLKKIALRSHHSAVPQRTHHPATCQIALFLTIARYTLEVMRLPIHTFKAGIATVMSLWMAVLACLMGCTLPQLASSASPRALSDHNASAEPAQPDLMAGMENCPHHSGGNIPTKPNDPKPARRGGMSCCPVEVTVASKPQTATPQISAARSFVLQSPFSLATISLYHSLEVVAPAWHSGRDTLLETHLLRI